LGDRESRDKSTALTQDQQTMVTILCYPTFTLLAVQRLSARARRQSSQSADRKSSSRPCLVFGHPRQQPFPKAPAQPDRTFIPAVMSLSATSARSAAAESRSASAQANHVSVAVVWSNP
jgi:hypothetical protein